jgi:hypothetical protein
MIPDQHRDRIDKHLDEPNHGPTASTVGGSASTSAIRARLHALAGTAEALDALLAEAGPHDLSHHEAMHILSRLGPLDWELHIVADQLGAGLDPVWTETPG